MVRFIAGGDIAGMTGIVIECSSPARRLWKVHFAKAPLWKVRTVNIRYLEVISESR
jgi:hypothetical protein